MADYDTPKATVPRAASPSPESPETSCKYCDAPNAEPHNKGCPTNDAAAPADSLSPEQAFVDWFRANYPPGCIISDPSWHAGRIYRALFSRVTGQLEAAEKHVEILRASRLADIEALAITYSRELERLRAVSLTQEEAAETLGTIEYAQARGFFGISASIPAKLRSLSERETR